MAKIIKVGHRGAMGYEPENTLRSFQKAIDLGADMIELDVHLCKSGELVVIHDETLERTTTGKGAVADKTLEELKQFNAGSGETMPTLKEVLDLVDKKAGVNIELKGGNTANAVSEIIDEYVDENDWDYKQFLVSSFNHGELKKFKEINPKVEIGLLVEEVVDGFVDFAVKFGASSVNIPVNCDVGSLADNAHKNGLKVYVWSANGEKEIEKAKSIGADYICSNFPDKI